MMDTYVDVMQVITLSLEALGVAAMLIGIAFATVRYLRQPRPFSSHRAYVEYRHGIGHSTLLGLDLLIAGDIIKTVIVHQTGTSVLVLGMVVLIRTFLGVTLYLEAEGRWPWQRAPARESDDD